MRRFFARNLLFIIGINLLIKPVWIFLIDRNVQVHLGNASYGTYQALLNLALVFLTVLDFGINSYNTRLISQRPQELPQRFPIMLAARLSLMLLYSLLVLLVALALGFRRYELALLAGIIGIQVLNMMLQFLRSNIAALHRFRLDGLLSILDKVLMIGVCSLFLFVPVLDARFSIGWYVAAQCGCYVIAVGVGTYILRRIAHIPLRLSFDVTEIVRIIRQSLPYALLIFLMAVYMRSDGVLMERLRGKDDAGIYAAAYRLLDAGNMFAVMFAGILLPLFGRMLIEGNSVAPIVRMSASLLLPVAFITGVAAVFFGAPVMQLLYHQGGATNPATFSWLMCTFPAYCVLYIYSTLLTANGNIKALNWLSLGGAVIDLSLNFWLIPKYGTTGGAITEFVTLNLMAVGFIWLCHTRVGLPHNPRWIASLAAYGILLAVIGWGSTQLPLRWQAQLLTMTAAGLLLMLPFRFVEAKAIKQLLLKR